MKKNHYSFLGLLLMFFITSSTIKSPESKRLFEKIIFVEINAEKDSTLFQPYSNVWNEPWNLSCDIHVDGSELMNAKKYKSSFENHAENLYTILHPMFIHGTIQSYLPYDPESFGFGPHDDGEMRYPAMSQGEDETFLTSETVRGNLCYLIGQFGPVSDIPLFDDYGDYLIITHADGTQSYQYPPPDYRWHTDKDIIKYKLRVSILIDKKGKEKKRIIKAICPVVNRINFDSTEENKVVGEKELLWFNFEELESTLAETEYIDENSKSASYLDYFQQKVKDAPTFGKE